MTCIDPAATRSHREGPRSFVWPHVDDHQEIMPAPDADLSKSGTWRGRRTGCLLAWLPLPQWQPDAMHTKTTVGTAMPSRMTRYRMVVPHDCHGSGVVPGLRAGILLYLPTSAPCLALRGPHPMPSAVRAAGGISCIHAPSILNRTCHCWATRRNCLNRGKASWSCCRKDAPYNAVTCVNAPEWLPLAKSASLWSRKCKSRRKDRSPRCRRKHRSPRSCRSRRKNGSPRC
jgi:hypothetical protein